MAETRRKFDQDFREGAGRLVRETGKPIAQVARDLGLNEGTPGAGDGARCPQTLGRPLGETRGGDPAEVTCHMKHLRVDGHCDKRGYPGD